MLAYTRYRWRRWTQIIRQQKMPGIFPFHCFVVTTQVIENWYFIFDLLPNSKKYTVVAHVINRLKGTVLRDRFRKC
jgi:hypothetical protein